MHRLWIHRRGRSEHLGQAPKVHRVDVHRARKPSQYSPDCVRGVLPMAWLPGTLPKKKSKVFRGGNAWLLTSSDSPRTTLHSRRYNIDRSIMLSSRSGNALYRSDRAMRFCKNSLHRYDWNVRSEFSPKTLGAEKWVTYKSRHT